MQYSNKLITLTMLCIAYTPMSFSCDRCDAIKAQYDKTISTICTKADEKVNCSCSKPPRPVAKVEEAIDCSCSHPKPVVKPVAKLEDTVDCSCSKPPRPIAKVEETIDCSCSHPKPVVKPVVKEAEEEECPYAAVEEIITDLIEKITILKNKIENLEDKENVAIIIKDLDSIIDLLEEISASDLSVEDAMEKVLEIKKIIDSLTL